MTMNVESWPVDRLIPYSRNPRVNADSVDAVAASIKEFGFRQPIVVDDAGVILVGHTRLKAAHQLGLTDVPVHVAEGLSEPQKRAYRIMDNRAGHASEWDTELLALEIDELKLEDYDLEFTGFDEESLAELLEDDVEQIDMPSLPTGDREPFQQMTFTLHDDQVIVVEGAIKDEISKGFIESENENSRGNALASICQNHAES